MLCYRDDRSASARHPPSFHYYVHSCDVGMGSCNKDPFPFVGSATATTRQEVSLVGIKDWFSSAPKRGTGRAATSEDTAHLREWASARTGVEAFVEPKTNVTETSVLLVAHDGEFTRRRINGPNAAKSLGKSLGIPVYDAAIVGYPARMRAYSARRTRGG